MDKKTDENLSDYYKVLIAMCKRQAGEKLLEEEKGLEGIIDDIGEDHAKLILDRLELLSKLREIVKNPKLEERLKLCENNLDCPDWWESGKHDRELIRAVLKYGLYRSDQFILNDPEFPFAEAEKRYVKNLDLLKSFKFDNPAELFKLAMGEVPQATTTTKSSEKPKEKEQEKEKEKIEEKPKEVETPSKTSEEEIKDDEKEKLVEEKIVEETPKSPEKASIVEEKEEEKEEKKDESEAKDDENKEEEKPKEEEQEEEKIMEVETEKEQEKEEEIVDKKTDEEKPMETEEKEEEKMETETEKEKEVEEEKIVDEKMEVDEPKISSEISEEKEEISKIEEEKPEPVVETATEEKSEEVDEKPKSPTPTTATEEISEEPEKIEIEKKEEEIVEVKKEPIERPEGEPKIIDTVIIDDDDTLPEKPDEPETTSKQAADLKARFPDLEIFQPLMKLKQFDAMLKGDVKDNLKALSRVFDTSMIVKWFREFALEKRISHIIYCVEKGVWPVGKSYSAYSGCLGIDLDLPLYETIKRVNVDKRSSSSTPDIITITTDHHQLGKSSLASQMQAQLQSLSELNKSVSGKKGQKRHIAIDVETERAKLHALLNNTTPMTAAQKAQWNQDDDQDVRRSSGSSSLQQPPPAHQHVSRSSMNTQYKPTVTIPGTSSTLTPIDLSSR